MRILLLIPIAAACTKIETPTREPACPAFRMTADGVSLPAMTTALAFSFRVNGVVTWKVDLSNHARTCEEYKVFPRILRDGEVAAGASTGGLRSVGIGNEGVTHEQVEIVGATPSKPGDKLVLCVGEASFTTNAESHKGQKIVMSGTFEGTYCGEQKTH